MRRSWRVGMAATMAGLLASAAVAAPSGVASDAAASAGCVAKTNVEAIVDDSGSMSFTDENKLRVQAMDLLIDSLPKSDVLGAVEFGSELFETPAAFTVFAPDTVGAHAAEMESKLAAAINADDGATDYNAAFAKADADNPNSTARIFLTDGGHDEGTYNEAHLAHNVPTYVIGFGSGLGSEEDQARLKKIADDTHGQLFPLADASDLQPVAAKVAAELTCETPPQEFVDSLALKKSKTHSVPVGAKTKALQITLSWASPLDRFTLSHLRLIVNGKAVAAARPKIRKLKVTQTKRSTFTVAKVTGLRKGTLRFVVKAAKIGSGEPKVKLTTQVGRGSGR